MLRVLTITNWYPPHHFGGYELSCWDVMRRFEQRGHEVHVLCSDERVDGAVLEDPEHESRVRRELTMYHRGGDLWRPGWRACLDVERANHAALARALAEVRPDVVSVWHHAALSFGLLTVLAEAGIPMVYAVCDDWLVYGRRLDAWADRFDGSPLRRAVGHVVRKATGVPAIVADLGPTGPVLYVSEATRRRALAASPWSFPIDDVVHSGIDPAAFPLVEPDATRPWRWRLVTAGRLDPRKGFETAIRALAHLPSEATLVLHVKGPDTERLRLETVAAELGLRDRTIFTSSTRAELAAAFSQADVVVFPSEWEEPFGLVPIEAMACGAPVAATAMGGSAEFLDAGRNFVRFDPGDAGALAAAVRALHDDPVLRAAVLAGGHDTAAAYDVESLAEVMERWHVFVAEGSRGPRPAPRPGIRRATPLGEDPTSGPTPAPVPSRRWLARERWRRWWRGDRRPVRRG